jgi:uncharacterized sulfatase
MLRLVKSILRACIALSFPLLILGLSSCNVTRKESGPPNFLVIITDDQSWLHAGAYGSDFIETPAFDQLAEEGILFNNAFVSSPSCGPSRGSLLTGQAFYRLQWASMNHTRWPDQTYTYADYLAEAGYYVGFTGKGWAPGNWQVSDHEGDPTGKAFQLYKTTPPVRGISNCDYAENFRDFLTKNEDGKPFCFWVGINEPHRIFEDGGGLRMGKDLATADVPDYYPDVPEIRGDLVDYAFEIEWFDQHLGLIVEYLEETDQLDNTVIMITSDNGMPFPRSKATCYDMGTRVPFIVHLGNMEHSGRKVDDMVSLTDIAPTIMELVGLEVPAGMTGTSKYLYLRNYEPERMPSGDAGGPVWPDDDPTNGYGDTDGSLTKTWIVEHMDSDPKWYKMSFGLRPAEELYEIGKDPYQMHNLAGNPANKEILEELSARLDEELKTTSDPRAAGKGDIFEQYAREYLGHIRDQAKQE